MIQFLLTTGISIVVAASVPLAIEAIRRPLLRLEVDDLVRDDSWTIAHVRIRNLPLAERGRLAKWLGHWLTAFSADGCSLQLLIFDAKRIENDDPIGFAGKWSSTAEPITQHILVTPFGVQQFPIFDPQKLPGIDQVTLQPGPDGDGVAVAIRARGGADAYAYWPDRIYRASPFPEHPEAQLPPGRYLVKAQARAGEVKSDWITYWLEVDSVTDGLSLSEEPKIAVPTPWGWLKHLLMPEATPSR